MLPSSVDADNRVSAHVPEDEFIAIFTSMCQGSRTNTHQHEHSMHKVKASTSQLGRGSWELHCWAEACKLKNKLSVCPHHNTHLPVMRGIP